MFTIEDLGLTKEEIRERVIAGAVENLLHSKELEDGSTEYSVDSDFKKAVDAQIKQQVDEVINRIGEKRVLPLTEKLITEHVFQQTTTWGEKKGDPMSFTEYMVARAKAWMAEEVDFGGKSKEESGSYHWKKSTTRLAYMIHNHLQCSIENAMKKILADANNILKEGIQKAVQIKLEEVSAMLQKGK